MPLRDFFQKFSKKKDLPGTAVVAGTHWQDRWSSYPSTRLQPERLSEIFQEADNGDIYRQMEFFEEMEEKDAHLAGILQTRKMAVLGLDYEVLPYSEEAADQAIAQFVGEIIYGLDDFEGMLLDLLDAIGKGMSMCEIHWEIAGKRATVAGLRWIHPKKISFVESLKPRLRTPEAWQGTEIPPWKVIYHCYKARSGYDTRAGMLRVVAWMYLCKLNALKQWASFNEVFGMPLRLGKIEATTSQAERDTLLTAIRSLGTDGAGVISKSTEIEFVEATGRMSGQANPFLVMAEFCNREMSKTVLGQTLTTDTSGATGTYSTAKVHDQVRRDLVDADAEALARTLRHQLIKPLVGFNFGWDKPLPYFRFRRGEKQDLKMLSEVYANLWKIGYPLTWEHLSERFGVPLPATGQTILGAADGERAFASDRRRDGKGEEDSRVGWTQDEGVK